MKTKRCLSYIISPSIKEKKCRILYYNYKYIIDFIIIIQKIWRGYSIRKKIKNIYKRLPSEIQNIVIKYIRKEYLIKKYQEKEIEKIIYKKSIIFFTDIKKDLYINKFISFEESIKLFSIYYLFTKYYKILTNDEKKIFMYRNMIKIAEKIKYEIDFTIFNKYLILQIFRMYYIIEKDHFYKFIN